MEQNKSSRLAWWHTYKKYVHTIMLPGDGNDTKSISYWRNEIFFSIAVYLAPLSIIALIPGVYMAFANGIPVVGCVDLLAFVLLIALLVNRSLSLRARKLIFIFIFYALSVVLLYYIGKAGPGLLFLLTASVLSSVIYSAAAGYYSAWANAFICSAFAFLNYAGIQMPVFADYSLGGWIAITSNLVLLSFLCAKCLDLLLKGLASSLISNQANEKRFRALVENATDAFVILSADGSVQYSSPSIHRILGYTEEEAMKLDLFSLLHPEDLESVAKVWERVMANPGVPTPGYTGRMLHKDGSWRWLEATATNMLHDDSVNGIIDNFRDVTEKTLMEEQQEFDRNNLDALINNTSDVMWSVDLDFNLITSNEPFNKATSLSGKNIGKGTNILAGAFSAEQSARFKAYYEKAFSGIIFTEIEHNIEPQEYWMEVSFSPIRKGNEVVGCACNSRNITQRKLTEAEREKMISNIVQHSKKLEQFAFIVSHNLRAPVAHMLGISSVLKGDLSQEDRIRTQEFLFKAAEQLDNVFKDLSKILELRSGISDYEEPIYFQELIDGIKNITNNLIEKEKIQINTNFAITTITSIKSYIHSIFYNLISNSIKYRQPDKVTLITIATEADNDRVKILYKDNGRGIDLTKHGEQVFGLYKRFHPGAEGKGLGLFMIKTQIEALEGTIEIKSKQGEGTEFIIVLPK